MKGLKYNLIVILLVFSNLLMAQNEAYYVNLIADKMGGLTEQKIKNGRVDIVTHTHAIEVEWAKNWKHSIGQALWYGFQTNKTPGIILIMKDLDDRKYGIMLQSSIEYAGISDKIKVWFYPEDFGMTFGEIAPVVIPRISNSSDITGDITGRTYSINKSSKVRHNNTCRHFDCKNCVLSDSSAGKACGICGG